MNQDIRNENLYTKRPLHERVKEIFTLAFFTIFIACVSIITMDIIVTPITLFAMHYKQAFNIIVTDVLFICIIAVCLFFLARKIIRLRRNGLGIRDILTFLALRPLYYITTFLTFLSATCFILIILFIILNSNQYLMYKLITR